MKLSGKLLLGAAAFLGLAALTTQPEFILPALILGGGAAVARRSAKEKLLASQLAEMQKRLNVAEGELEFTSTELEQLRVEREFDRQLLRSPEETGKGEPQ